MKPPREGWVLKAALEIPEGCCFVKQQAGRNGFAYLRVSVSSAWSHGLKDPDLVVYGVCYNGNMAVVDGDQLVWSVPREQMEVNRRGEAAWKKSVGVTETSPYLDNV